MSAEIENKGKSDAASAMTAAQTAKNELKLKLEAQDWFNGVAICPLAEGKLGLRVNVKPADPAEESNIRAAVPTSFQDHPVELLFVEYEKR